jgi:hypothetical protein
MSSTTAYTNYFDKTQVIIIGWDENGQDVFKVENPTEEEINDASAHYYSSFPSYAISVYTWEVLKEKAAQLPCYEEWLKQ